jgi:hypothetical protein
MHLKWHTQAAVLIMAGGLALTGCGSGQGDGGSDEAGGSAEGGAGPHGVYDTFVVETVHAPMGWGEKMEGMDLTITKQKLTYPQNSGDTNTLDVERVTKNGQTVQVSTNEGGWAFDFASEPIKVERIDHRSGTWDLSRK